MVLRTSAGPSPGANARVNASINPSGFLRSKHAEEVEREQEEEALGQAECARGRAARSRAPRSAAGRCEPGLSVVVANGRGDVLAADPDLVDDVEGLVQLPAGTRRPPTTTRRSSSGRGRSPGPTSFVNVGQPIGVDADHVRVVAGTWSSRSCERVLLAARGRAVGDGCVGKPERSTAGKDLATRLADAELRLEVAGHVDAVLRRGRGILLVRLGDVARLRNQLVRYAELGRPCRPRPRRGSGRR